MLQRVWCSVQDFAALLPHPKAGSHKYSRGILHVIGGSAEYPGAAAMAASSAQRMGAGYTQVWCAPESVHDVRCGRPSLVVRAWDEAAVTKALETDSQRQAAVLFGPGIGVAGSREASLLRAVLRFDIPLVVDGGGLKLLADYAEECGVSSRLSCSSPMVLTPHAGEAATLCKAVGIAERDPKSQASLLADAYGATVVLKGPDTYVSDGSGVYEMTAGSAALAKAGTGDVLAGIIGALLAQGLGGFDAGCIGSYLHAEAGNCAAHELTDICVIPEDVIAHIPSAIRKMEG